MSWFGVGTGGAGVGGSNKIAVGPAIGALVSAFGATLIVAAVGCKRGGGACCAGGLVVVELLL